MRRLSPLTGIRTDWMKKKSGEERKFEDEHHPSVGRPSPAASSPDTGGRELEKEKGRDTEGLRWLPVLSLQHSPDVHRLRAAGSAEEEEEDEKRPDLSPNSQFLTERCPKCHRLPPHCDGGDLQVRRRGTLLAEDERLDQRRPLDTLGDVVADDVDPPVVRHRGYTPRAGVAVLRLTAATDLVKLGMEKGEASNGIRRGGV